MSLAKEKFIVRYGNHYYDISEFYQKHPGGINTLKGLENTDMTNRFVKGPVHSAAAMYLMNEYRIPKHPENINQIDDNNNDFIDESMEHLVDWSKPMLQQIPSITKDYDVWVHKPVDRALRLFGPWYLEILTKTPWWILPIFWLPTITYLVYSEGFAITNDNKLQLSSIALHFTSGIIIWTLVEYILHRFLFHMNVSQSNLYLCTLHFLTHGLHHKVPFDPYRLVFPPGAAALLASIFYIPVRLIFPYPRIIFGGALLGYLFYDLLHYYLHYGNPKIWHFYQMKRYHYQHHFAHQNMGFGVSSPFWDYVFRSRIYLRNLRYMLRW